MTEQPWLQTDDELLLDRIDYRVEAALVGRTDRLTFQRLTVTPQLGGEPHTLVQLEDGLLEARQVDPELLTGERVELGGREFALRWDSDLRTERREIGGSPAFGQGRCAWYAAEGGAVAALIAERYERTAFAAEPIAAARVDLRFTVGLRGARG